MTKKNKWSGSGGSHAQGLCFFKPEITQNTQRDLKDNDRKYFGTNES